MKLVLDTNVVIDWLVFDDAFLASFREQVLAGHITIVTHAPALDELRRVLGYRELKLDDARRAQILARYQAQTSPVEWEPPGQGLSSPLPQGFPRCRDPDDNPFLHLAWHAKADALVSRDNAVLKLARRVRRFGFQIFDVPQMVGWAKLAAKQETEAL